MKILVVANYYPPYHGGGYGILCQRLAEGLAARDHSLYVLTSSLEEIKSAISPCDLNMTIDRRFRGDPANSPFDLLAKTVHNRRMLVDAISRFQPDLLYCFAIDGIGFDVYEAITASTIPSVTVVGDTWLAQAWRNVRQFDPWMQLASADGTNLLSRVLKRTIGVYGRSRGVSILQHPTRFRPVQCISHFLLNDLNDSGAPVGADTWILPCPIHRDFFSHNGVPVGHSNERTPHLKALFVSRMEHGKGPDTAIQGIAEAVRLGANVTLTLAGLAAERVKSQLNLIAAECKINDRIGWVDAPTTASLVRLYQQHDVFLFPSRILEGFGIVNAEAMACGLPVIGTTTGGSADIIHHGVTGFSIRPGEYQELGLRVAMLAQDRPLLNRLSLAAIRESRRYYPETILDEASRRLTQYTDDARPTCL